MMTGVIEFDGWIRLWWLASLLCLLAGIAALVAQVIDPRQLAGVGVWVKPAKFGISLALHFATLGAAASLLSPEMSRGPILAAAVLLSVGAAMVEMLWIVRQAGLAEPSHFNVSTPFHAAMYRVMAGGALLIIGAAAAVGIMVMADANWAYGPAVRAGLALGLIGGTALTLLTAFSIGAAMSPHVGVPSPGAAVIPLVGWSLAVGDLRVSHFLATHMLQVVPVAALVADRLLGGGKALAVTWMAAAAWALLTVAAWMQARAGIPLLGMR